MVIRLRSSVKKEGNKRIMWIVWVWTKIPNPQEVLQDWCLLCGHHKKKTTNSKAYTVLLLKVFSYYIDAARTQGRTSNQKNIGTSRRLKTFGISKNKKFFLRSYDHKFHKCWECNKHNFADIMHVMIWQVMWLVHGALFCIYEDKFCC